jgi:hypothetical protein
MLSALSTFDAAEEERLEAALRRERERKVEVERRLVALLAEVREVAGLGEQEGTIDAAADKEGAPVAVESAAVAEVPNEAMQASVVAAIREAQQKLSREVEATRVQLELTSHENALLRGRGLLSKRHRSGSELSEHSFSSLPSPRSPVVVELPAAATSAATEAEADATKRPKTDVVRPVAGGGGGAPMAHSVTVGTGLLRRAFEAIDLDGSGTIGKRELYVALRAIGIDGTSGAMVAIFKHIDTDHSGQLSWEEFKRLGARLPQLAQLGASSPVPMAEAAPTTSAGVARAAVPAAPSLAAAPAPAVSATPTAQGKPAVEDKENARTRKVAPRSNLRPPSTPRRGLSASLVK